MVREAPVALRAIAGAPSAALEPVAISLVPPDRAPVADVAEDAQPPIPDPPRAAPAPRAASPTLRPTAPPPPPATAPPPAPGGTLVLASWYGPGFYGNRTACGQTYTAQLQGVAHRTLPCGTVVTLTYGGRTVSVPVIDRGPYIAGRTLDLSNATHLALACPDLCSLLMRVGN